MIILVVGGGSGISPHHMDILEQIEEEGATMNPYYGYSETFGSDWKIEKRLEREEKVKGAQSYKKKNQRHPAFRK